MLEYAVSRNVVRECLDMLRDEGLIERIQGSGTFARVTKAQHEFDHVHAIRDSVAQGRSVAGAVLTCKVVLAPRPVADKLAIRPGEHCMLIEYTVVSDAVPFSLSTSYLSLPVAERLSLAEYRGDFYELFERAGYDVRGGAMTVDAVPANARTASILRIGVGEPLMMFHRELVADDGTPLESGFIRCRGDRISLKLSLPRVVSGVDG
jgi:GntR family transcriptional regulator